MIDLLPESSAQWRPPGLRQVSPVQARASARAELELRRRRRRKRDIEAPGTALTFKEFIREVSPAFNWYPHAEKDAYYLQAVADDELKRYMRFYPPRHGKSELGSRLFPAYYIAKHPDRWFLLTGHTASLVQGMGLNARDHYLASGRGLRRKRMQEWETYRGGGMRCFGVRGSITGKGFHCGAIDDPIKDALEASSDLILKRIREWYDSTFSTRAEPGAAILLTMTRWRYNDLAGHILEQELEEPEHWQITNFEAIRTAVAVEKQFPETCSVTPDDREEGEALCRERYDEADLGKIRRRLLGSGMAHFWHALYMQRPGAEEGVIFKRAWFSKWQIYDTMPADVFDLGYDWDLAYSENDDNSGSAYIYAGRDAAGNAYVEDVGFDWLEFPELLAWMGSFTGPHYIEAKGPGKSAKQTLSKNGIIALEVSVPPIDKVARARLSTPPVAAGKIFVNRRVILKLLDHEKQGILKFPNAENTDLTDAFVQMINRLLSHSLPRYRSLSSKNDSET